MKPLLVKIAIIKALVVLSGCSVAPIEDGKPLNTYSCYEVFGSPELVECAVYNDTVRDDFLFHMHHKKDIPFGDPSAD